MYVSNSELLLRRARTISDPDAAIGEYLKAIEQAVRELKEISPAPRPFRRR